MNNRVSLIQELAGNYQWMHVPSESNPAGMKFRGYNTKDIISSYVWWNAPKLFQEEMHL